MRREQWTLLLLHLQHPLDPRAGILRELCLRRAGSPLDLLRLLPSLGLEVPKVLAESPAEAAHPEVHPELHPRPERQLPIERLRDEL